MAGEDPKLVVKQKERIQKLYLWNLEHGMYRHFLTTHMLIAQREDLY